MAVKRYYVEVFPYNIQEGDNTIVNTSVFIYDQNDTLFYEASFSASSTRNPVDKPNSKAGLLIALGRAFSKAGKRMETVGNSLNKHDEDVKVERGKQAEKKTRHDALNEVAKISQEMGAYDLPKESPPPGPLKDDDVYE